MTPITSTPLTPALIAAVRDKLQQAAAPLKLADVAKKLPKPKKLKAPAFQDEVRTFLDDEVRLGRLFAHPSGKGGTPRYWSRDEKQLLAMKAMDLTATPQTVTALKKALAKEAPGTDAAFVEAVLRELVVEGRLFEHPAKTKKAAALLGASPPPPPLAQPKHAKAIDKLAKDCDKLLGTTGATIEALLEILKIRLGENKPPVIEPPPPLPPVDLEELILNAVSTAPVLSLADLRRAMPLEARDLLFDQTVLRLADERRVILFRDADPLRYTPAERRELIEDGGLLFTTIAKGETR